ncbi:hypothetical protein IWQ60_004299 [Tieghemiomyces parasiticus]|uniref:Uncharacterized protein n=1 Tax=Tieghemiomyces parasiticus TaxID=78921 RepID=A0A9W8A8H5_9FUNG|nr:hypothetical protein IWQ60_004299 [Tieghemiomyces parasiticus]
MDGCTHAEVGSLVGTSRRLRAIHQDYFRPVLAARADSLWKLTRGDVEWLMRPYTGFDRPSTLSPTPKISLHQYSQLRLESFRHDHPLVFFFFLASESALVLDNLDALWFNSAMRRPGEYWVGLGAMCRVGHDLARVAILRNQLGLLRAVLSSTWPSLDRHRNEGWKRRLNLPALYLWALNLKRPALVTYLATLLPVKDALVHRVASACHALLPWHQCRLPHTSDVTFTAMGTIEAQQLLLLDGPPQQPFAANLYLPYV